MPCGSINSDTGAGFPSTFGGARLYRAVALSQNTTARCRAGRKTTPDFQRGGVGQIALDSHIRVPNAF